MNKPRWTPGPWELVQGRVDDDGSRQVHVSGGVWDEFASVWVRTEVIDCDDEHDGDDQEGVANANLIVSAPQLYDILDQIAKSGQLDSVLQTFADEALSEARGENND